MSTPLIDLKRSCPRSANTGNSCCNKSFPAKAFTQILLLNVFAVATTTGILTIVFSFINDANNNPCELNVRRVQAGLRRRSITPWTSIVSAHIASTYFNAMPGSKSQLEDCTTNPDLVAGVAFERTNVNGRCSKCMQTSNVWGVGVGVDVGMCVGLCAMVISMLSMTFQPLGPEQSWILKITRKSRLCPHLNDFTLFFATKISYFGAL